MALKRWQFTREFKLQVLQEGDSGKSISQLARIIMFILHWIHRWRQQLLHAMQAQATSNRITLLSLPEIIFCLRLLEMND